MGRGGNAAVAAFHVALEDLAARGEKNLLGKSVKKVNELVTAHCNVCEHMCVIDLAELKVASSDAKKKSVRSPCTQGTKESGKLHGRQ